MDHRSYRIGGESVDGEYVIDDMPVMFIMAYCDVRFFDAAGQLVTPTDGDVRILFSLGGDTYQLALNGEYNAADTGRIVPAHEGPATHAKLELIDIDGAESFEFVVYRYPQ